jgi:transcriptional regulator with XRE-family HTH domain
MSEITHDPVDTHVGRRLRSLRKTNDLSQKEVAGMAGISFQQLQKYERGNNRISASRLWALAKGLKVPVGYFFEGLT